KEYRLLKIILDLHHMCDKLLDRGILFREIQNLAVREEIARAKFIPEDRLADFDAIRTHMVSETEKLSKEEGVA
ncbi:MAG: V-type ATP synthase subunit A, partial [Deltaproteobacteria bacterium]|nr:V-type ATP synthase subunit A [Deltaproteobacteria bacterium]